MNAFLIKELYSSYPELTDRKGDELTIKDIVIIHLLLQVYTLYIYFYITSIDIFIYFTRAVVPCFS